ncbi:MAG TPA: hypothetical protein VIW73_03980 [Candidatus Cybelea sp.]
MHANRFAGATLAALVALALAPMPQALGAESGLAWDSVTKFSRSGDAATLRPGSFDQDYAQAAAVAPPPEDTGGGVFAKMKQAMAMAQHLQALLRKGFAERHYVAGSRERIDAVSEQKATILDCAAGTITTLDLRRKTYRVESLNAPSAPSSSGSAGTPQPRAASDVTSIAITIANRALGARNVGGQPTTGFSSEMSFKETKASGESQSYNGDLVGYYSRYANPSPACERPSQAAPGRQSPPDAAQTMTAMTEGFKRFTSALALAGADSRFSLKQSGPALPRGKFAMYQAATIGGGPEGGATFVGERGNLRPVSADDPVFSVPSDFTREQ